MCKKSGISEKLEIHDSRPITSRWDLMMMRRWHVTFVLDALIFPSMKWIKKAYLRCIPLCFGVCLSFYCFFFFLRLLGYVPLNRVWFSRSWVLNRVYSFTIKRLEQGVFLDRKPFKECEDLRWMAYPSLSIRRFWGKRERRKRKLRLPRLELEPLVRSLLIGRRKQWHVILAIVLVLFGTHHWWTSLPSSCTATWPRVTYGM